MRLITSIIALILFIISILIRKNESKSFMFFFGALFFSLRSYSPIPYLSLEYLFVAIYGILLLAREKLYLTAIQIVLLGIILAGIILMPGKAVVYAALFALVLFFHIARTKNCVTVDTILILFFLMLLLAGIYGFIQAALRDNIETGYFFFRQASFFTNPVNYAEILIAIWPFALWFVDRFAPKLISFIAVMVISIILLTLTGSRSGVLIIALQVLAFVIIDRRKTSRLSVAIIGLLVVVFSIAEWDFVYRLFRRFLQISLTTTGYSSAERLHAIKAGLAMGFDHFYLGVGLGNYADNYLLYNGQAGSYVLDSAHSFFVNLFAEIGAFGCLIVFCFFIDAGRRIVLAIQKPGMKYIFISFFGSFLFLLFFGGHLTHGGSSFSVYIYMINFRLIRLVERDETVNKI